MTVPRRRTRTLCALAGIAALAASPAAADIVGREKDITDLRLGQRIYVDDGSCPAGQIKEVTGTRLTAVGVARTAKCVERRGKR